MVLRKLLGQTDLKIAQVFCIYKSTGVIMVNKSEDLIFAAFYVIVQVLKILMITSSS